MGSRSSLRTVSPARSLGSAPRHESGERSASGSTKPSLPVHASSRRTRNGEPTTERRVQKSSASSATSLDEDTGEGARECAENYGLQPTSVFSLPQPTLHASPSSRFVRSKADRKSGV